MALKTIDMGCLDYSSQDLSFSDLQGRSIISKKFCSTILDGSNLENASVRNCDFSNASLSYANLERAFFAGCTLVNTSFRTSNMFETILSGVDCRGAVLSDAKLFRTCFDDVRIDESTLIPTKWRDVIELTHRANKDILVDYRGKDLSESSFRFQDLGFVDLSGADLRDVDFSESVLTRVIIDENTKMDPHWRRLIQVISTPGDKSTFESIEVKNTQLIEYSAFSSTWSDCSIACQIAQCDFRNAVFRHCRFGLNFANTDFSGATFEDCSFYMCLFENCCFRGARLKNVTSFDSHFTECDMEDMCVEDGDFRDTGLFRVSLARLDGRDSKLYSCTGREVDLSEARLRNVYIGQHYKETDFEDINCQGADLSGLDPRIRKELEEDGGYFEDAKS